MTQNTLPAYGIKYPCNKKLEVPSNWSQMSDIQKIRWIDKNAI